MPTPTITELYEEYQRKVLSVQVVVQGTPIFDGFANEGFSLRWGYQVGRAPTADIVLPNPVAGFVKAFSAGRRPPIQIYVGWSLTGFAEGIRVRVFTGEVLDLEITETETTITAVGMGNRLERNFKREVKTVLDTDVNVVIAELMDDAGITNYVVDLVNWEIGDDQEVDIEYQRFGDAVSMLSQFNGSPWFELPSGQIHVRKRDPLPSVAVHRQYYSGVLSQLSEAQHQSIVDGTITPVELQPATTPTIANLSMWPRLLSAKEHDSPRDVKNRVHVHGGLVETLASDGTIETNQVESTADAGSPWVPTPPEFNEVQISLPVLLSESRAAQMAARYVSLYNRLDKPLTAVVEGDPEVYLTATVQVTDLDYSGVDSKYFVWGYDSQIDTSGFVTTLDLRGGGPGAGTEPKADPWADFTWYTQEAGGGKKLQVVPSDAEDENGDAGDDDLMIILILDGSPSGDWDGSIVSYSWSTDTGKTASGKTVTFAFTPGTTVEVTLEVTDNDGRTDEKTKTITITDDLAEDDTESEDEGTPGQGGTGGRPQVAVLYAAAGNTGMATNDGGLTYFDQADSGLISVGAKVDADGNAVAVFGSSDGQLIRSTDYLETEWDTVFDIGDFGGGFSCVVADSQQGGVFWAGTGWGRLYVSTNNGVDWDLFKDFGRSPNLFKIENILTPPDGSLIVAGGETTHPTRMLFRSADRSTNFVAWTPSGELATAIAAAGSGHDLLWTTINGSGGFGIGFSGGVEPPFWYALGNPWVGGEFIAGGAEGGDPMPTGIDGMDGGIAGVWLLADGSNTWLSEDGGETFTNQGSVLPAAVDQILWEKAGGAYLGSTAGGIIKTIDYGLTWGFIRPNVPLGLTWPAGANCNYLALQFVAPPITPGPLYAISDPPEYRRLTTGQLWQLKDTDTPPAAGGRLRSYFGGLMLHSDVQSAGGDTYGVGKRSIDEGETWDDLPAPGGGRDFLVDSTFSADGLIWAIFGANGANGYGLYTSPDGDAWSLQEEHPTAPTARAAQTLAAHPTDPNRIGYIHRDSSGVPSLSSGISIRVTEDGSSWVSHSFTILSSAVGANVNGIWLCWLHDYLICMYQNVGILGGPAFFFRTLQSPFGGGGLVTFGSLLSVAASAAGEWNGIMRCGNGGPVFAWRSRTANSAGPVMWRTADGVNWESIGSPIAHGGVEDGDPDDETNASTNTPSTMVYDLQTDRLYTQYGSGDTYFVTNPGGLGRTKFAAAWTPIADLPDGPNAKQTLTVVL